MNLSLLFGILHAQYERFNENVSTCMKDIVSRRSFDDAPHGHASGAVVFNTLTLVLVEYVLTPHLISRIDTDGWPDI
jgi:hypothetical protein